MAPKRWLLNPAEFDEAVEKVEKTYTDAKRQGFTGKLSLPGRQVKVRKRNAIDFPVTEILMETEITGAPAVYDGWEVLATEEKDDQDDQDRVILRGAPGAGALDRDSFENLQQEQDRGVPPGKTPFKTYLVMHRDGRKLRVPEPALKGLLGRNPVFIAAEEIESEVDKLVSSTPSPKVWDKTGVLAAAWMDHKVHGEADANRVGQILNPPSESKQIKDQYGPHFEEGEKEAPKILDWVFSTAFHTTGDVVDDPANIRVFNLKGILGSAFLKDSDIELVSTITQDYNTYLEKTRANPFFEVNNFFMGEIGLVVEVDVTVREVIKDNALLTTYVLLDSRNRLFRWTTSAPPLGDTPSNNIHLIRGTIVNHLEDEQGLRYTELVRVAVVESNRVRNDS